MPCRKLDTRRALVSFILSRAIACRETCKKNVGISLSINNARIFIRGHYLFREPNSFPRAHKSQGKLRAAIKDMIVKTVGNFIFIPFI